MYAICLDSVHPTAVSVTKDSCKHRLARKQSLVTYDQGSVFLFSILGSHLLSLHTELSGWGNEECEKESA